MGVLAVAAPSILRAQHPAPELRTSSVEVPLRLIEGRLIVPVEIVGAGTQHFILDTAASSSVISARLRNRLDLDPDAVQRDTVRGSGGTMLMEKVLLPGLRIAHEVFTEIDPVVLDFSEFREYDGVPVEGILGTDVLLHYAVEIDVAMGALRLAPRLEGSDVSSGIPFESRAAPGLVEFSIELDGHPVRAVLDSGAEFSVLNWEAAGLLSVTPGSDALRSAGGPSSGITGGKTASRFLPVEVLHIGPAELRSTRVKIAELAVFETLGIADGAAMLVGVDVVRACTVRIDYGSGVLQLCP